MAKSLSAPETKVATPEEGAALADFLGAFESYKQTNDERLAQVERRGEDPLTQEKLARIDAALETHQARLDAIAAKARRPGLEGLERTAAQSAHGSAFDTYVRHGEAGGLKAMEAKALNAGTPTDGGYLVPFEAEAEIGRRLALLSPMRALSTVRTIGAGSYRKPFMTSGPVAGWAAETAERPQTLSPVLTELSFPAMELYAMPAATPTLLEDARVNVEEWLATEVEAAFAEQEGNAFIMGDGEAKPKGFLGAYLPIAESAFVWGKVGYVPSGGAADFAATNPGDALVDLVYALKAGYRQNGTFLMNRRTQAAVRKLKDGDGNHLWAPPAGAGQSASLLGFPIAESEDMPDMEEDAFAIAFGDFRRFYLVVDRAGVRVLRDPYSAKPYVLFYTTKRVGGGIQDFDAVKLMKFAES